MSRHILTGLRTRFVQTTASIQCSNYVSVRRYLNGPRLSSRPVASFKPLSNSLQLQKVRTMFIQTESTPNENAIKFIPGVSVLGESGTQEFLSMREAMNSPLAKQLFLIDGVESVFFGPDFVSVNKSSSVAWPQLKPDIFSVLMDFFTSGQNINAESVATDTRINPEDSETVQMIKELLETRIRPAIQEDGGDIEYLGFEEGLVKLKLRGACRTCDSSSVTLQHGIQNMLMHYIPEVTGVEQVADELEEVSKKVFEDVDQKIHAKN